MRVSYNFNHAAMRWYAVARRERDDVSNAGASGRTLEALDHLCGLAVEVGMKALLIKLRKVQPGANGDYPSGANGRKPHVNELWDIFMANVQGRQDQALATRLQGSSRSPLILPGVERRASICRRWHY